MMGDPGAWAAAFGRELMSPARFSLPERCPRPCEGVGGGGGGDGLAATLTYKASPINFSLGNAVGSKRPSISILHNVGLRLPPKTLENCCPVGGGVPLPPRRSSPQSCLQLRGGPGGEIYLQASSAWATDTNKNESSHSSTQKRDSVRSRQAATLGSESPDEVQPGQM